jgi:hypothetical protein
VSSDLLARILRPLTPEQFVSEWLEKSWTRIAGDDEKRLDEFFSLKDIEDYLFITRPWERRTESTPPLRVVRSDDADPSLPVIEGLEDAMHVFAQGYTLVLNYAHLRWPALARLCAQVARGLACTVTANVYCTPPGRGGFRVHHDTHDVLILQTSGVKHWRVLPVERRLPPAIPELRGEVAPEAPSDTTASDVTLGPDDVLYLPRGTPHEALAGPDASVHVTVGLHPVYWYDLAHALVDEHMLRDVALRRRVPPDLLGGAGEDLAEYAPAVLRGLLDDAGHGLDVERVLARMYRGAEVLLPDDGIAAIVKVESVSERSRLRVRRGAHVRWGVRGEDVWFALRDREISVPSSTAPYLEYIEQHPDFVVGDLPDHLPLDSRVVFARWLVARGLAVLISEEAPTRPIRVEGKSR